MTRLSKGERPFLLYLLILPYLVLRFFLFDKTDDTKTNGFLTLWRILPFFGFLIIWAGLVSLADDPPPTFENADVFVGEVVAVNGDTGGSRQGGNYATISLLSEEGVRKKFKRTRLGEHNDLIKQQLGNSMTIWSYKIKDSFFLSRNYIIDVEINGRRLWNNWPEIKQSIEAGNPWKWIIFGLLLAISPFYKIWKLLIKKTNSD